MPTPYPFPFPESHVLRTGSQESGDALHTHAVCAAVKRARRAILLTGTPSLTRPFDVFRQVRACTCMAVHMHGCRHGRMRTKNTDSMGRCMCGCTPSTPARH
jgi:hypothetical protein